jgi:hypothetical protein
VAAPQLLLDVQGPKDGSTLRTDAAVVHGFATPGATVTVNGQAEKVGGEGRFRAEVSLAPGTNRVEVVATDVTGDREMDILFITYVPPPPQPFFLVVTEPRDQSIVSESPIRLSGRTMPDAVVSVSGVGIPVDDLGAFWTMVTMEPGPNIIDVVATNAEGRVLSTVVALIYRPL